MVAAVLVAVQVLGMGLGSIAVVAGALGLGIGFGLQTLASNFVSGVVLLLEQAPGRLEASGFTRSGSGGSDAGCARRSERGTRPDDSGCGGSRDRP